MAEETLVKEPLSKERIEAGRRLIEVLDQNRFDAVCVYWLFRLEDGWRLVVATPLADREDTALLYSRIQTMIAAIPDEFGFLSLRNIEVVRPKDEIVQALTNAVRTGREISGIHISRSRINSVFVEDAYVYRATIS